MSLCVHLNLRGRPDSDDRPSVPTPSPLGWPTPVSFALQRRKITILSFKIPQQLQEKKRMCFSFQKSNNLQIHAGLTVGEWRPSLHFKNGLSTGCGMWLSYKPRVPQKMKHVILRRETVYLAQRQARVESKRISSAWFVVNCDTGWDYRKGAGKHATINEVTP